MVIHERDFKDTTTYPLPSMVFTLCKSAGLAVWHIDVIKTLPSQVDIGIVLNEATELAPNKWPRIEVQRS